MDTPDAKNGTRKCRFVVTYGGPDQDRTDDLCIANAALSQLSYRPKKLQFIGLLNWVNGAA